MRQVNKFIIYEFTGNIPLPWLVLIIHIPGFISKTIIIKFSVFISPEIQLGYFLPTPLFKSTTIPVKSRSRMITGHKNSKPESNVKTIL
jgi:hypothetical protein